MRYNPLTTAVAGFVMETVAGQSLASKMVHDDLLCPPPVSPAIIRQAIWLYVRFTLSYRDVEDLLAERGLDGLVTLPTKEGDGPGALEILSSRNCLAPRGDRRGARSAMR